MNGVKVESEANSSEQLVTIELFGQPFTFKAEIGTDKAKAVAEILIKEVDRAAQQVGQQVSSAQKQTILLIAALNIANQNVELRQSHVDFLKAIGNKSIRLIHRLDANEHKSGKNGYTTQN